MTTHVSEHDILQDLVILEDTIVDKVQQDLINRLRRHIRALWHRVQRLESMVAANGNEIVLRVGEASLVMKKDGTVAISGRDVTINGVRVDIKSQGTLSMKGAKILEN
jgi:hypothetical protein